MTVLSKDKLPYDQPSPHRMRILVVDDEKIKRITLADDLTAQGHEVVTAADGQEAIERLAAGRFDVVVTDLKMPKLDGIELLNGSSRAPQADMEVIMMTAYGSIPVAVEAVKLGAFDFLTKPFRNEDVLPLLARIERQRQAAAGDPPPERFRPPTLRPPYRPIGRDRSRQADGRNLRQDRRQRALVRRDGRRQGPAGHDDPSQLAPPRLSLRQSRLHALPAATDRKRALRPRKRLVHRRRTATQGTLRLGRRRHALSRRR